MTTASPEKVAPVSAEPVTETVTSTSGATGGPSSPVPLPVTPSSAGPVEEHLPGGEGGPLDRLRPLVVTTGFSGIPETLADLLLCSDDDIRRLVPSDSPTGALMRVLKGAFAADWFRAKSCLVFGKWPAHGAPNFGHDAALELMTGFTRLRGNVHTEVKALALKRVKTELVERGKNLAGNTKLRDRMAGQTEVQGDAQVEFKGQVGADTVTSDVDVSTGGLNSEVAIRAYNDEFRKFMGLKLDPGTVFDLNVYAKDFIFGWTENSTETVITPNQENAERPSAPQVDDRDREQDIWALVHVARYMPVDSDWATFVSDSLAGLEGDKLADQRERLVTARRRAKGFEWRLLSLMADLCTELDLGIGTSEKSWGKEAEHFEEGALRMRAANKLYEDKLLQVKDMRTQIELLREELKTATPPADGAARLASLVSRLSGELSMAQLYANEVYGSGGATVHAVLGMQIPKKLTEKRKKKVTADLPKREWYQSFIDNLGDVLKDFEHYGKAGDHGEPDHWYAAFKMGKYANRMVDCLGHLSDGAADDIISTTDAASFAANPHVLALTELSTQHLLEKDGVDGKGGKGGADPITLKKHPYFGEMNQTKLDALRAHAIALGSTVRGMAAKKGPATAVPARGKGGMEITPKQLTLAQDAVKHALSATRELAKESAGPKPK